MGYVKGCCCFSLKTGSIIIATLGWMGTVVKLFGTAGAIGYKPAEDDHHRASHQGPETLGYRIGYCVISLICCILLVVGIYRKAANFFIPWLIVSCLEAILVSILTVVFFVFIFLSQHPGGIVFGVLFGIFLFSACFAWYFWLVVFSHYHEVKFGDVNVVTGTGGNVYYSPTATNPPAYNKERTQMA